MCDNSRSVSNPVTCIRFICTKLKITIRINWILYKYRAQKDNAESNVQAVCINFNCTVEYCVMCEYVNSCENYRHQTEHEPYVPTCMRMHIVQFGNISYLLNEFVRNKNKLHL